MWFSIQHLLVEILITDGPSSLSLHKYTQWTVTVVSSASRRIGFLDQVRFHGIKNIFWMPFIACAKSNSLQCVRRRANVDHNKRQKCDKKIWRRKTLRFINDPSNYIYYTNILNSIRSLHSFPKIPQLNFQYAMHNTRAMNIFVVIELHYQCCNSNFMHVMKFKSFLIYLITRKQQQVG